MGTAGSLPAHHRAEAPARQAAPTPKSLIRRRARKRTYPKLRPREAIRSVANLRVMGHPRWRR